MCVEDHRHQCAFVACLHRVRSLRVGDSAYAHRFLRGKTVDRSRYDQWKDQTQPVSAPDGDEMTDVEVHVASFAIQGEEEQVHVASFAIVDDDDEQVHVPSNYTDKNEKDSVLLLAKLVPA